MTYDELCINVMDAMEKMDEMCAVPKCITLSPEAFNILAGKSPNRPKFMGMNVRVGYLPKGVEFVCSQEDDDGTSYS